MKDGNTGDAGRLAFTKQGSVRASRAVGAGRPRSHSETIAFIERLRPAAEDFEVFC
ncbi:MAG: hypothetical protein ABR557_08410 [Pyrinomonadaceae bacterium]